MPAATLVQQPLVVVSVRRFELPDLDTHGGWVLQRLLQAYPHLTTVQTMGWLRGIIYSNEFQFLYCETAVSLVQVVQTFTLLPTPVVQERFVFCKDKENPEHVAQAAEFYTEMKRWAEFKGFSTIIVDEMTDVPYDTIKEKLGNARMFKREQTYVRLGK